MIFYRDSCAKFSAGTVLYCPGFDNFTFIDISVLRTKSLTQINSGSNQIQIGFTSVLYCVRQFNVCCEGGEA
jgi:hypothetical protein